MKIVPLLFLLMAWNVLLAQKPSKTDIINSRDYYYGTGVSYDENQAKNEAIGALSEMISVTVQSSFENRAKEVGMELEKFAESIIKTYSTTTINNVEEIPTIHKDGQIEIFYYLAKSAVNQIYDERAEMAYQMYLNSLKNVAEANLNFALKNLYFASILIKSLPDERVIRNDIEISLEVPRKINQIIQGINFRVTADRMISSRERQLSFDVSFKNKPVSLLQFRFWDGNQFSANGQVRDGKSCVKLVGNSVGFDELKVFIIYNYYNARLEYKAVEELWDLVSLPVFENLFIIDLKQAPPVLAFPKETHLILEADAEIEPTEKLLLAANSFIHVLETGYLAEAKSKYGDDLFLYEKISSYMNYNNPKPARGEISANVNKTRSGYEIRKLMVNHEYPSLHKQATEYLVLDFDTTGTLVDFNLCITDQLYEKFVREAQYGQDWGNRQEIIKFIEKYRTAFHTRDIGTINKMFAEEALILIGRIIQPRKNPASEVSYQQLKGQPDFVQIQYTKSEYLKNQQRVFDKQKDIFIDFSTFEIVKKNNAPGVYGVEMRQNYSSTTYADEGYLFLLIDFNGNDPLIYIRAWQPNEWDSAALVNTSNFRIYK